MINITELWNSLKSKYPWIVLKSQMEFLHLFFAQVSEESSTNNKDQSL